MSLSNGGVTGVAESLCGFDRLPYEVEDRSVLPDKLARALEVFCAKAAKERRLREIVPKSESGTEGRESSRVWLPVWVGIEWF